MKGIIGKKVGMTSVFLEDGTNVCCTLVEAGPNYITQIKTEDTDGYLSYQLAFDDAKEKNTSKPMQGHFKKAGVSVKKMLHEFRDFELGGSLGDKIDVAIFEEGETVTVTGTSKGKGFQGVVKRHGFHGVGDATHGQHNRLRAPGSLGPGSTPSRVYKGMRMAGRTGGDTVTLPKVKVVKIFADKNLILLKGAVPGARGSYVTIQN